MSTKPTAEAGSGRVNFRRIILSGRTQALVKQSDAFFPVPLSHLLQITFRSTVRFVDAIVGRYEVFVAAATTLQDGSLSKQQNYKHDEPFVVLFNPWCKGVLTNPNCFSATVQRNPNHTRFPSTLC